MRSLRDKIRIGYFRHEDDDYNVKTIVKDMELEYKDTMARFREKYFRGKHSRRKYQ